MNMNEICVLNIFQTYFKSLNSSEIFAERSSKHLCATALDQNFKKNSAFMCQKLFQIKNSKLVARKSSLQNSFHFTACIIH